MYQQRPFDKSKRDHSHINNSANVSGETGEYSSSNDWEVFLRAMVSPNMCTSTSLSTDQRATVTASKLSVPFAVRRKMPRSSEAHNEKTSCRLMKILDIAERNPDCVSEWSIFIQFIYECLSQVCTVLLLTKFNIIVRFRGCSM